MQIIHLTVISSLLVWAAQRGARRCGYRRSSRLTFLVPRISQTVPTVRLLLGSSVVYDWRLLGSFTAVTRLWTV